MQTASLPAGVTTVAKVQKQVPQQAGPTPAIPDSGSLFTTVDNNLRPVVRPLEVPRRGPVVAAVLCVGTALERDKPGIG